LHQSLQIGVPDTTNGFLVENQAVRAGGPSIPIAFQSSNASAGLIVTEGVAAASRTVTLAPGFTIGTAAFRPVAAGSTNVTVSSPGVITTNPGGTRTVTVTP